jgi:deazaflavin-dependent oxidoreductase (nitroreductase family)
MARPSRTGAGVGAARGTDRIAALDDLLADDTRFARLRTRGRRSGASRPVTVGFVDEPDGSILVAAGAPDSGWARNLLADPVVEVEAGGRSFHGIAEALDDRDPRRGRAVRDLILRYGTPSEGLGSGPIFVIRPVDPVAG